MLNTISTIGAILALVISITLIVKKVPPSYSLMIGAIIGALIGGASLNQTVNVIVNGSKNMMPAVLRILGAGILSGVLIQSGAASKIARKLTTCIGEQRTLLALAITTCLLTAIGVFVDIAVITVAPIALSMASRYKLSRTAVLLAMIGGGKCGNIISPNPNTIAAATEFQVSLTSLMVVGIIPALFGLVVTVVIATYLQRKKTDDLVEVQKQEDEHLPSFFPAIIGPVVAIFLLMARPLFDVFVDPLVALPIGGVVGLLCMGKIKKINEYITYGLSKMSPIAILLIGTGAISGVIQSSFLKDDLLSFLHFLNAPSVLLAPLSGIIMSGATASTTAGTTVASSVFSTAILASGIIPLYAAGMLHAGATVLDHMPHGSFFHATAGCTELNLKKRFQLIPYESLVGLTLVTVSVIVYEVIS